MFFRNACRLALFVMLVLLVCAPSGCGSNISGQLGSQSPATPAAQPDSVQITIKRAYFVKGQEPQVTLHAQVQVQRFYQTLLGLPFLPKDSACTANLGPHYTLTFYSGTHKLVEAEAKRDGCRPVTIAGESQDRAGSQAFWDQLDQAIYAATPPATVQALAIQHTLQGNQPAQTARITDAVKARSLYNALVGLPLAKPDSCNDGQYPEYQMIFQARDQNIPAIISQKCNTISLNGNYKSRGGLYTITDQFKQLFTQTLAGTTFAPAQPDTLTQTLSAGDTSSHGQVTDAQLRQQIYASVFNLKAAPVGPDCPSSADKIKGTAKWYTLEFSQWSLPILTLTAYEGTTCKLVQPSRGLATDQTLVGDTAFWDLIHRAAHG